MDYSIDSAGGKTVIALKGRLTFNDHASFRDLIKKMLDAPHSDQVIDLSALDFVDSAGLGMLLIAREELQGRDAHLSLAHPHGQVRQVLNVAHLSKIIEIVE
jgi:anti-anti-sigma factor